MNDASSPVPSMLRALQRILSPSGFPYASNWVLFRDAHFGRDALEIAEDLLPFRPDIARATILRLAHLQGARLDPRTEEEPGKIHHEYRSHTLDGHPIAAQSMRIFRNLAESWHLVDTREELEALTEMVYYGTVDATPLYVRLVARYASRDPGILDQRYRSRGDAAQSEAHIGESVQRAVRWLVLRIESSDLGLLEFRRMSPYGHIFQAWKDGGTSYVHPDGTMANYGAPIASIEVQGLAYDALTAAPALLPDAPQEEQAHWRGLSRRLQRATIERFWMPVERYFAMAIDRDPRTAEPRQVRAITSNPGALLDSGIFDSLDPQERERYVSAVVERIYSPEFLTPAGVRCSSTVEGGAHGYHAYQSTYTVWHKETYDVARGLRRQGFPRLSADLENRLLNAVNLTGGAREFLYVMRDGRVDYRPTGVRMEGAEEFRGTNVPENDQGWSVSAALAIKWRRGRGERPAMQSAPWQRDLEARKRREVPPVELYRTVAQVEQARASLPIFWIDTRGGWEAERAFQEAAKPQG